MLISHKKKRKGKCFHPDLEWRWTIGKGHEEAAPEHLFLEKKKHVSSWFKKTQQTPEQLASWAPLGSWGQPREFPEPEESSGRRLRIWAPLSAAEGACKPGVPPPEKGCLVGLLQPPNLPLLPQPSRWASKTLGRFLELKPNHAHITLWFLTHWPFQMQTLIVAKFLTSSTPECVDSAWKGLVAN